jgi:hypothetical protein
MEQITIAGKVFNAPLRYEEGHELNAGEASALNQTYHENLRNNFAKKVKEAVDNGGFNQDALQAEFDAYALDYQFGVRTGGGGAPRDPVMAEAMNIAKMQIRAKIKEKGRKITDYEPSAITEAAKKLIAKNPAILELARQRVEEAKAAASDDLGDFIADLEPKAA